MQRHSFAILVGLVASLMFGFISEATSASPSALVVVPVDSDGVQRVTIEVDSYSYTPNHLQVEVGKPVELILNSVTIITPHNFVLKEPAARAQP